MSFWKLGVPVLAVAILISPVNAGTFAASVVAGSDYFTTLGDGSTTFAGAPFMGVPVGPGNTDTIVQRQNDANFTGLGDTESVNLLMTTLTLESVTPINLGAGVGFYFITLQSAHGGPASTGSMAITLNSLSDGTSANPEGTFSSSIDVFFDVRFGAANGPVVLSSDLVLSNSNTSWDATPTANSVLVQGVVGDVNANDHTNLNAATNQMDLFPVGTFTESHPTGAQHTVEAAFVATPEPATYLLIGGAFLLCALVRKRK